MIGLKELNLEFLTWNQVILMMNTMIQTNLMMMSMKTTMILIPMTVTMMIIRMTMKTNLNIR